MELLLGALGGAILASLLISQHFRRAHARLRAPLEAEVARLEAERQRLDAALEGLPEAVIGLDDQGCITGANGAARALLGRPTVPHGERLATVVPALAQAAQASEGAHPVALPGPQGTTAHFMARVARPAEGPHTGRGRMLVLLDVTRLRQLEQIRRDFVANVSHELRTPVSVIRVNAETLRDGALADPVRARTFLDALLRNAERLSDLVADLLDIARIESGRTRLVVEPLPVVEPAVAAFELVEPLAVAKGTTIDFALADGLWAWADARSLTQVFVNLLENAVKYTPAGSSIVLAGHTQGEGVRLEVRDDGPGIPQAQRERVFERFYRLDAGRAKEDGGTGLGLAIVKHLVGAMGGRVGVEANHPQGCVFWVELPTARPSEPPRELPQPKDEANQPVDAQSTG